MIHIYLNAAFVYNTKNTSLQTPFKTKNNNRAGLLYCQSFALKKVKRHASNFISVRYLIQQLFIRDICFKITCNLTMKDKKGMGENEL